MKFKLDKFVLAIITVVILAYFFPDLAKEDSPINLGRIGSIGISFIFFFYGLKLSPKEIASGLKNWRLHVLIQSTTFLLFPLLVLPFKPLISAENETLWLAFLFLAALPSTVSSSVVMVSIAKGNIPAAIFNASISGLIGIVVTPLWIGLFQNQSNSDYDLGQIYLKLLTEILLPVFLGLILHRFLGKFAKKNSKYLTLFDKSVILLIIYKSFSESFLGKIFESVNFMDLILIFCLVITIFIIVYLTIGKISKWLGFLKEDQITAKFCGTKKSLVHGTVFSDILFQHTSAIGILLLPLMLFHAIQIFIISIIANKLSQYSIE
ncbi:bile acid:sodium symporter [Mangrovimonas sp. AS39]|uniref:bile acid:sodium symporter family protein n=1 Tax=Mangrovimonas futianensis TaxID=2895523 RepID=UPI001E481F7E|nr:bile acid:sodium symporter family protein [Mangrovimonas futianensis]MCF1190008.1 bile acid:sodium symporter [Mangrovimonas futianensis]MCF1194241.1 bile acid:sodium symporter [Mangrovimonas futianensis]